MAGGTVALFRCTKVTTTCDTPVKVSDDATYKAFALFPNAITAGADGTAYIALDGSGLAVVLPRPDE